MRKTFVVARRELAAYFVSPMAYVIGALFLAVSGGYFFQSIFVPGEEASLRPLFEGMAWLMVAAVPLLTMRLLSDEVRMGTIETLMTAPISDAEVIAGKFLGVLTFYLVLLAMTVVFLVLMGVYGQPDAGVAVMGYFGMVLLGAAFLAAGVLASALTRYQVLAAVVGAAFLASFTVFMQIVVTYGSEPWSSIAARLNAMTYFKDFSRGVFDTRGLVFFLTATVLLLFLSVKVLESRRWR